MYSRTHHLFAAALSILLLSLFTGFSSPEKRHETTPTNKPTVKTHTTDDLLDLKGLFPINTTASNDNLKRTPTTMDWRKDEGPKKDEGFDLFKMMSEPVDIPDSLLHDLRVIGSLSACYEPKDNAKNDLIYPNGLTAAACEVVGKLAPEPFKVFDYAIYPQMANVDQGAGHDAAFTSMKNQAAALSEYYLLLGIQINPADGSVIYKTAVKLPRTGNFSEVNSTVEELIASDVLETMEQSSQVTNGGIYSIVEAEIAGMKRLKEILEQIISDTYNTSMTEEMLYKLGFLEIKTSGISQVANDTSTFISANIKDYANVSIEGVLIRDNCAAIAPTIQSKYSGLSITVGAVLTDNPNYDTGKFGSAGQDFEAMDQKIIIWLHYFEKNGVKKLFAKSKDNLTIGEAQIIVDADYESYASEHSPPPPPPPYAKGGALKAQKMMTPNCASVGCMQASYNKDWSAWCGVMPCFEDPAIRQTFTLFTGPTFADVANEALLFGGGFLCGLIDGFVGELTFLCSAGNIIKEAGKFVYDMVQHTPGSPTWYLRLVEESLREKSISKGLMNVLKRDNEYWQSIRNSCATLVNAIGPVLSALWSEILNLFESLTFQNGSKSAGYEIGQILYDSLMNIIVPGGHIISKYNKKIIDGLEEAVKNYAPGIAKAVKKVKNSDERIFNYCKRKGMCFLAGTLVCTPIGAISIENLNPFSSTVDSSSYNNTIKNKASEFILSYMHDNSSKNNLSAAENFTPQNNSISEITPESWKWVSFKKVSEDGTNNFYAHLRRPNHWIMQNHASNIGNQVYLNLPELGINEVVTVTNISYSGVDTRVQPYLAINPLVYQPITGWFERTTEDVWDYVFSSGDTISATPTHPFFSEDKQVYLPVGEMVIGENVKLKGEKKAFLCSKIKRSKGLETVYNIEVWQSHNYFVGKNCILVHNDCANGWLDLFFGEGKWKRDKINNKKWVTKIKKGREKEVNQAETLGEYLQKEITLLGKDKNGNDFPAIDAIDKDGNLISLKEVTATNIETLKGRIKDISEKIVSYNNRPDVLADAQFKNVLGMVTAKNFTVQQITDEIFLINADLSSSLKSDLVKEIFIEGSDGVNMIQLIF